MNSIAEADAIPALVMVRLFITENLRCIIPEVPGAVRLFVPRDSAFDYDIYFDHADSLLQETLTWKAFSQL